MRTTFKKISEKISEELDLDEENLIILNNYRIFYNSSKEKFNANKAKIYMK